MSSAAQSKQPPDPQVHPLVRNTLRFSLSAKEYKLLHEHVLKRSASIQSRVPTPCRYEAIVYSKDKYGEAAIRASLRVFLLTTAGSKLAEFVVKRITKDSTSKYAARIRFHRLCSIRANIQWEQEQDPHSSGPFADVSPGVVTFARAVYPPYLASLLCSTTSEPPDRRCATIPRAQSTGLQGSDLSICARDRRQRRRVCAGYLPAEPVTDYGCDIHGHPKPGVSV
jgi:hypothetical protein